MFGTCLTKSVDLISIRGKPMIGGHIGRFGVPEGVYGSFLLFLPYAILDLHWLGKLLVKRVHMT